MSSPQRSRSGVHTGAGGHSWVTGVGAAQDRIRAAAGRTDVVLDRLVHAVSELVDAPATVALLEDGELVRRAATGDGRLPLGVRVETATSVCGEALRTGRPVRLADADAAGPGRPDASCCPPARSLLSVPLAVRDTCIGVVALTADRPDWFDGVDENTVSLVAEVAADVILAALPERVTPRTADRSPVERPAERSDEPSTEEPVEQRVEQAGVQVVEQAVEPVAERAVERHVERVEKAVEKAVAQADEQQVQRPAVVDVTVGEEAPARVELPADHAADAVRDVRRSDEADDEADAESTLVLAAIRRPVLTAQDRPVAPRPPLPVVPAAPPAAPLAAVDRTTAAPTVTPSGITATVVPAQPSGPTGPWVPSAQSGTPGGPGAAVDVTDGERSVGDLTVRRDVPEPRTASDAAGRGGDGSGGDDPTDASSERRHLAAAPTPADDEPPAGLPVLGLWQWDAATGLATLSEPVEELTGMPSGRPRVLGAFRALVHPDDVERVERTLREAAARPGGDTAVRCTFRLCRRDGTVRTVQVWGDLQRNRYGLVGAVGVVADITALAAPGVPPGRDDDRPAGPLVPAARPDVTDARRDTGEVPDDVPPPDGPQPLADVASHLRAVRELTGAGVWSWLPGATPHEGRLEWSPEMYRLVGLEPGEIAPTLAHWHGFVHDEDVDKARAVDLGALRRSTGHGETFRIIGADGAIRHVQAWADGVADGRRDAPDAEGAPAVVHGAAVDVTRQVRDRLRLERLVATDPVTGLANRAAFERAVTQMLAEPGVDVALLLLDVDRFKQVNDSLGHDVGDRLLLEVARRLNAVVPEGTTVARMGGDEFVVLPRPGSGMLAVRRIAEAVTDALRMPYVLPDSGELLVCPVSLGITSTSGRAVSPQDLLAEAELALYRAKDSGRDRFVVYDEALRARSQSRMRAERLLRGALEHGRLMLQYQPIVDFANGRVVGAEALVRIRDESGDGLLPPDVFIDVAEDTGLVVDLDRWVIETAIDQVERWANQVAPGQAAPWLSVNVSARSMEHPGAVRGLLDAVRQRRVAASDIKVELTERSFLAALPGGEGALRQLLGSGIPVGIDDFGTGYSALGYLNRFELDFMKIDRSFVQSVGEDPRADAVVTAIVDLAHAHGMLVTAEGVETPRQARRLREIGCDLAQGYHFGRPADAARIIAV